MKIKLIKGGFDSQGSRLRKNIVRNIDNKLMLGFNFIKPFSHAYTNY